MSIIQHQKFVFPSEFFSSLILGSRRDISLISKIAIYPIVDQMKLGIGYPIPQPNTIERVERNAMIHFVRKDKTQPFEKLIHPTGISRFKLFPEFTKDLVHRENPFFAKDPPQNTRRQSAGIGRGMDTRNFRMVV
jgi:hypothetical protein